MKLNFKERVDKIKSNIDLAWYVESILKIKGSQGGAAKFFMSPFRTETKASFHVLGQVWFDPGHSTRSGDIVDLVAFVENVSKKEALSFLEDNAGDIKVDVQKQEKPPQYRKIESNLDVRNDHPISKNQTLLKNIGKRGISSGVAQEYLRAVYYYKNGMPAPSNRPYFSVGWKNILGEYEVWSMQKDGSSWRSNTGGRGKKAATFIKSGEAYSTDCMVFEGMFDFLSYLEEHRLKSVKYDVIILNGWTQILKLIDRIENLYKDVYFYGDNDTGGHNALSVLKARKVNVIDKRDVYQSFNDYNEYFTSTYEKHYTLASDNLGEWGENTSLFKFWTVFTSVNEQTGENNTYPYFTKDKEEYLEKGKELTGKESFDDLMKMFPAFREQVKTSNTAMKYGKVKKVEIYYNNHPLKGQRFDVLQLK